MAKKRNNHPMQRKSKRPKLAIIAESFITEKIEFLCALGWAGYMTEGRGFILVTVQPESPLQSVYVGADTDSWKAFVDEDTARMEDLISEYDPKTQILIVLAANDDYIEVLIPDNLPLPPPLAYEMHKDRFE